MGRPPHAGSPRIAATGRGGVRVHGSVQLLPFTVARRRPSRQGAAVSIRSVCSGSNRAKWLPRGQQHGRPTPLPRPALKHEGQPALHLTPRSLPATNWRLSFHLRLPGGCGAMASQPRCSSTRGSVASVLHPVAAPAYGGVAGVQMHLGC